MPASADPRLAPVLAPRATEAMILSHRPLALRLAHRYRGPVHQREDLEQVACEGLIKAVRRYDPGRGYAFTSFAVPTILGELRRFHRDTGWSAHVPRAMQERALAVRRARDELAAAGRRPTVADLEAHLGWDEEAVLDALAASCTRTTIPLEGQPADGDTDTSSPIEHVGALDPGFDRVECLAAIEVSLEALSAAQKQVLRLRFLEDLRLSDIASRIGVSEGRVSHLLSSALSSLRERVQGGKATTGPPLTLREAWPHRLDKDRSPELLAA